MGVTGTAIGGGPNPIDWATVGQNRGPAYTVPPGTPANWGATDPTKWQPAPQSPGFGSTQAAYANNQGGQVMLGMPGTRPFVTPRTAGTSAVTVNPQTGVATGGSSPTLAPNSTQVQTVQQNATTPQPPPAGSQPTTGTNNGSSNSLIQALTQPIGADLMSRMLNQANAGATGGAVQQNDQLRNQSAASGFGAYNPATTAQQIQNTSNGMGQVAQNNFQIPYNAAQYNAQYGLGMGELNTLAQNNLSQEALGGQGLTSQLLQTLMGFAGNVLP